MFCSKCGCELNDGAAFCHKCGEQQNQTNNNMSMVVETQTVIGPVNDGRHLSRQIENRFEAIMGDEDRIASMRKKAEYIEGKAIFHGLLIAFGLFVVSLILFIVIDVSSKISGPLMNISLVLCILVGIVYIIIQKKKAKTIREQIADE